MKIGAIIPLDREITLNEGKPCLSLMVANLGDRRYRWVPIFIFLKLTDACLFKGKKHMASIWTFRQEHPFDLNRGKKKKLI